MQEKILQALQEAGRPLAMEALVQAFTDKQAVEAAVKALADEQKILFTRKRKLSLPAHAGLLFGRLQGHARGFAFFIPADRTLEDLFVPAEGTRGAMHGDGVWVRHTGQFSRNGLQEAEVVLIAARAYTQIVGLFERDARTGGYVVPDEQRIPVDVLIPTEHAGKAKAGDKVVARILQYSDGRRPMVGAVVEVLGNQHDVGTDIRSIVRQYQLPETFSKAALRQAKLVDKQVQEADAVTREDLTGKCVITIDGRDAKDLDDAISLERLKNGNLYLGVHIADVAHYVKEGSALDKDALERGTSVYLADRVIPMLPPALSNGICSLHPGEERLTLSCFMEIDPGGRVLRHRLAETLIRSSYRLVYEDVTALLQGDAEKRETYQAIVPMLEELEALCLKLHARREKRGSIDFDIAEAHISLDAQGHPTDVEKAQRGIANRIIEECMLIANETVAAHMYDLQCPFMYRIHEKPDKDKLQELQTFLQSLGYPIRNLRDIQPRALQRVLQSAKGAPDENIVSKVVLRAMQKARYSDRCLGHFGLAAARYCHFTSPIRRYPDLTGHRVIKQMLHGQLQQARVKKLTEQLPAVAEQCSRAERNAMEAERAVDDLKKCEFMKAHIGETYAGIISGVTSFGFFVELNNTVEGLVRASALDDDFYVYEEKQYRMVGRNHGRMLRLGDEVKVCVSAVHMQTRTIDFIPVH